MTYYPPSSHSIYPPTLRPGQSELAPLAVYLGVHIIACLLRKARDPTSRCPSFPNIPALLCIGASGAGPMMYLGSGGQLVNQALYHQTLHGRMSGGDMETAGHPTALRLRVGALVSPHDRSTGGQLRKVTECCRTHKGHAPFLRMSSMWSR
jgi:hypothetical protein